MKLYLLKPVSIATHATLSTVISATLLALLPSSPSCTRIRLSASQELNVVWSKVKQVCKEWEARNKATTGSNCILQAGRQGKGKEGKSATLPALSVCPAFYTWDTTSHSWSMERLMRDLVSRTFSIWSPRQCGGGVVFCWKGPHSLPRETIQYDLERETSSSS